MNKILKSSMIAFVKAWVETLGTIIFLFTLAAIVVGMLGAPLQITLKANTAKKQSAPINTYIKASSYSFEDDFVKKFFFEREDYKRSDSENDLIIKNPYSDKGDFFTEGYREYLTPKNSNAKVAQATKIEELVEYLDKIQRGKINLEENADSKKDDEVTPGLSEDFKKILRDNYNSITHYIEKEVFKNQNKNNDFNFSYEPNLYLSKSGLAGAPNGVEFLSSEATLDENDKESDLGKLIISKGRNVQNNNEIVVSEKFAIANNLELDKPFNFLQFIGAKHTGNTNNDYFNPTIVGYGTKYDTMAPTGNFNMVSGATTSTYGLIFAKNETIYGIFNEFIKGNITSDAVFEYWNRVYNNTDLNVKEIFSVNYMDSKSVYKDSTSIFVPFSALPSIQSLNNINVQVIIYIVLGILILLLAFMFINFVIKKELSQSRVQLGIFKAFGYRNGELSWIYALKTFLTLFIGLVIGYILSIPLQMFVSEQFANATTLYFNNIYYAPGFLGLLWIAIPLLFTAISYFVTLKYLHESALKLISNANKVTRNSYFLKTLSWIFFPFGIIGTILKYSAESLKRRHKGFTWRLQQAFTQRGLGKFVAVVGLFTTSAYLFTMQLSALDVMNQTAKAGFGAIQDKVDHRFGWNNHGHLKTDVFEDKDDPNGLKKVKFDIADENWKTSENENYFEYIDYSGSKLKDAYDDSVKSTSEKITNVMKSATGLLRDGVKLKDILESDNKEIYNNLNLIALMGAIIAPIDQFKERVLDPAEFLAVIIYQMDQIIKADKDEQKIDQIFENTIYGVKAEDKNGNNAIAIKDFSRFVCLSMPNAKPGIDCNDPENWTPDVEQLATRIAEFKEGEGSNLNIMDMISSNAMAILSSAVMVDKREEFNPLIVANQLYYNSDKEMLSTEIPVLPTNNENIIGEMIELIKKPMISKKNDGNNETDYGNIRDIYAFKGISDDQLDRVFNPKTSSNIPAIVSYNMAKIMNLRVGDQFLVNSDSRLKISIPISVVGINKGDTFGTTIFADYDNFFKTYGSEAINESSTPLFNTIWSQYTVLNGSIDLNNIKSAATSMKFQLPTLSVAMNKDKSLFSSLLGVNEIANQLITILGPKIEMVESLIEIFEFTYGKEINEILEILELKPINFEDIKNGIKKFIEAIKKGTDEATDEDSEVLTALVFSTLFGKTRFMPFNMMRSAVGVVMSTATAVMSTFLILVAFLLLIILVVVMNIVVDEAARIILTMRSIGYRSTNVNWMVMGNYIIWGAVGFVFAYVGSILSWYVISNYIWSNWAILLTVPIKWQTPVIAFIVLAVIMGFGWIAAMHQIKKRPLTKITS